MRAGVSATEATMLDSELLQQLTDDIGTARTLLELTDAEYLALAERNLSPWIAEVAKCVARGVQVIVDGHLFIYPFLAPRAEEQIVG